MLSGQVASMAHDIRPYIEESKNVNNSNRQYKVKLSKLNIGHLKLIFGHLITRDAKKITYRNTNANLSLKNKHCLVKYSRMELNKNN